MEVFAAFTGPEGGITSISNNGCNVVSSNGQQQHSRPNRSRDAAAEDCEDFDYIDLEDLNNPAMAAALARRNSSKSGAAEYLAGMH